VSRKTGGGRRSAPVNPMVEQVGPEFYDTDGVMGLLAAARGTQVTRGDVGSMRETRSIVALQTADERWVYPTWQFTSEGDLLPGLEAVLGAFAQAPRWSVATWLTTPLEEIGDRTPVARLQRGEDVEKVTQAAQRTAVRWAE
jgi:hypothetical protein